MRVHGEKVCARGIHAGHHEVGADVALVAEEVLLEHRHDSDDARAAAGGEGVQLEVGGSDGGGELGVGSGAGAGAPDGGGYVMQLLAVFVCDDGARGRAGIGCDLWKERW